MDSPGARPAFLRSPHVRYASPLVNTGFLNLPSVRHGKCQLSRLVPHDDVVAVKVRNGNILPSSGRRAGLNWPTDELNRVNDGQFTVQLSF